MLDDIEKGKIDCVIVKDFSRLGRNMIDVGYYIQIHFPKKQVRFISVNDMIDTLDGITNISFVELAGTKLPLITLNDEEYTNDISSKAQSVINNYIKEGKYVAPRAPFGYTKSPDDCHALIPDPEAAPYANKIGDILPSGKHETKDILFNILNLLNNSYRIASDYTKRLSFTSDLPTYEGPLFDYQDFLVPLLSELNSIVGFPSGTIYLLIDDAHFLSEIQTRVLNSWIATRTSRKISLKVSTQYNYKNYYTVTGATVDTPHDYSEVDMTTVYTAKSGKSSCRDRIQEIVTTRLKLVNIDVAAEEFFPEDKAQEEQIAKIAEAYRKKHDEGHGRGYRGSDDAVRYSRPDFIKNLAGISKSSASYSYAGFDQLVHLSSGILIFHRSKSHP